MSDAKSPRRYHTVAEIARAMTLSVIAVLILTAIALFVGVSGYHWLGRLSWVDSLLNASMILGGMGPVDTLRDDPAKVFASFYALFSGLFFIAMMGVILARITHIVMHRFHVAEADIAKETIEAGNELGSLQVEWMLRRLEFDGPFNPLVVCRWRSGGGRGRRSPSCRPW